MVTDAVTGKSTEKRIEDRQDRVAGTDSIHTKKIDSLLLDSLLHFPLSLVTTPYLGDFSRFEQELSHLCFSFLLSSLH